MNADQRLIIRRVTSSFRLILRLIMSTVLLMGLRFRSSSLRFKIAFFVVILLTCTSFALCIITVQIMNNYVLNEIIKRGESVGKSVAASAGYSLLSKDLLSLDNLVFKAKSSNNDMEYMAIITQDNKVIAHSEVAMSGGILPITQGRRIRQSHDGTTVKELPRSSDSIFEISSRLSIILLRRSMLSSERKNSLKRKKVRCFSIH